MNINKQLIFRYKLHTIHNAACLSSIDTEICGISSFLVFTIMYTGVLNHIACQEEDGINSLGNFVN